ncbi:MAG TPA: polysaccharide deacetylase family protein [Kofleriaceae bacterium]|jgi:peptidoglycan/xylan/chitin deacetylase (PgdA/CDA1 family)|nr:polysaccharide deacetylase family protein [Kofleriaceae bacterium]
MLFLLAPLLPAVAGGLGYLACYGGFEGPVDWAMDTAVHGSRDRRVLALTFDDGPDPDRTPALLDALAELGVAATFFVLGEHADQHPELCARIAREGHELGNHTYTHPYLPLRRSRDVADELARTDAAIARATGIVPTLARPPYGGRSPRNVKAFRAAGKQLVLWDVNSYDWKGAPGVEVAERIVERARPGSIILMHDGGRDHKGTLDAVKLAVPALRERGYTFETVSRAISPPSQPSL